MSNYTKRQIKNWKGKKKAKMKRNKIEKIKRILNKIETLKKDE